MEKMYYIIIMNKRFYWICESFNKDGVCGIFRTYGCFDSYCKAWWEMYKLSWKSRHLAYNKLYIKTRNYPIG